MTGTTAAKAAAAAGAMILPLALAQFVASYAAPAMNMALSAIATEVHTDVTGVQTAITRLTLTMAVLMIPGSKLTGIWGRQRCLVLGLTAPLAASPATTPPGPAAQPGRVRRRGGQEHPVR